MSQPWHFLLHQDALEFSDACRPVERRKIREALRRLADEAPPKPDGEIPRPNKRTLYVRHAGQFRIIYWLDVWVREIVVVQIDRG